jgi:cardiolipin synthase
VSGNRVQLAGDSNEAIDWMVADIDAAGDHVHLLFYIWLEDNNGRKMAEAVARAAARGVSCRVMVDGLGSRAFIRSASWRRMREAGVELRVALPIGSLLLRPLRSRIDIRNHRKIVVIDGCITYCGSQNCADPEFRVKPRFAPWIDAVLRLEGPVALQKQHLFAHDWITEGGEGMTELLQRGDCPAARGNAIGQVVATGPTYRNSAMPEMFVALIYSARRELIITTPYYVPNQTIQDALCASARRGVSTTLVLPARNDSRFVAAASRSYYADLLAAGVRIHEYPGGLLHSKTLVVDGELCLVGSANLDQRSFDLNYENNVLICDHGVADMLRKRQRAYITASVPVTETMLNRWSPARRLWNNLCAIISPVL